MNSPSSAFRINQEGYAAGLPVYVAVLGEGPVILKNAAGETLRVIAVDVPETDPASGDAVTLLDLGTLEAGTCTLERGDDRRQLSVHPFSWNAVTHALIKGLYYQRCGCGLTPEHAGVYAHPPCHTAPAAEWENRSIHRSVPGGWHDAGDYGKYVAPGAVTVAHLLYAWKLFPQGCSGDLNIPETGSGVPDILSEARFELEWILRMQRSDGAFHHKLTKARFAPFIMPQDDLEQEYLMPVCWCATGGACACLALASRVYRPFNAEFADRMLASARRAWDWLQAHPDYVPWMNPEGVHTGWYGGRSDVSDRFWAACEMYAATGVESFRAEAERLCALLPSVTQFGWMEVSGLGSLCCLCDLKEKAGNVLYTQLKEKFLRESEEAFSFSRASGYGTDLPPERYTWGGILSVLSGAMEMIVNTLLTGRKDMRDAALLQWHYALGMNALDLCFDTGFGERRVMHPHHRPSGADGIEDPVPGLISGGPNKNHCYPHTREVLGQDTPPAKYFLDETPSADTNEIAIYWNSPAVFVGAFFNMLSRS